MKNSQKVKFGYFDLLTLISTLTSRGQIGSVSDRIFFRNGLVKSHTKFGAFVRSVNICPYFDTKRLDRGRADLGRLDLGKEELERENLRR